jgi:hypothetical protein
MVLKPVYMTLPNLNPAVPPQQPAQPSTTPVARYITPDEKLKAYLKAILSIRYLE